MVLLDIKMPKTCEDCNLESICDLWVDARKMCGEWKPGVEATIRHPDCPLTEFTEEQERLEEYIQFYKGCIDKLLTLYHIADANTLYEQGIKDGAALASMHGSDATSQDLEESYFNGMEAGAEKAWQIAHDILSEKIPLKIFNPKPGTGNLFMFNWPFMQVLNIIREWENQHDN